MLRMRAAERIDALVLARLDRFEVVREQILGGSHFAIVRGPTLDRIAAELREAPPT